MALLKEKRIDPAEDIQRWLGLSIQRFASVKCNPCRVMVSFAVVGAARRAGVAQPEWCPNNGGEFHAAANSDWWSK